MPLTQIHSKETDATTNTTQEKTFTHPTPNQQLLQQQQQAPAPTDATPSSESSPSHSEDRFSQHMLDPARAFNHAFRQMRAAQQQMAHLSRQMMGWSPFDGGFGPSPSSSSFSDPFSSRPASSSLWNDPFFTSMPSIMQPRWPSLLEDREWGSDFFETNQPPEHRQQQQQQLTSATPSTQQGQQLSTLARPSNFLSSLQPSSSFRVQEEPDKYSIIASVPGWRPEEVKVEVEGNKLILQGERREESKQEGEKDKDGHPTSHSSSRSYSYFRQSYTLPPDFQPKDLSARFHPQEATLRVEVKKPHALPAQKKSQRVNVPLSIEGGEQQQQPLLKEQEEKKTASPSARRSSQARL